MTVNLMQRGVLAATCRILNGPRASEAHFESSNNEKIKIKELFHGVAFACCSSMVFNKN